MQAVEAQFFTIQQFVVRSGLSDSTVRRRLLDGSLPRFQPGGRKKMILIPAIALEVVFNGPGRPAPAIESVPAPVNLQLTTQTTPQSASSKRPLPGPQPRWQRPTF
jgi:hypothetical protein